MSLYSPRIKIYNFGTLTQTTNDGEILGSTAHPIVGELIKVVWDNTNTAADGSLFVQTTAPIVATVGSVIITNADKTVYFSAAAAGASLSSYPVVAEPLHVSGAGLGLGSSGKLYLYYR